MRDRRGIERTAVAAGRALALAACLAPAAFVQAGGVSASLAISVVVPARAVLAVETQPTDLRITEEDVARGWVAATGVSLVHVRTNSPAGWLLEVQPLAGPYRSLEVTGLGATAQVSAAGGWLAQPFAGRTAFTAELRYRFYLSAEARPGLYPWPVALAAAPR